MADTISVFECDYFISTVSSSGFSPKPLASSKFATISFDFDRIGSLFEMKLLFNCVGTGETNGQLWRGAEFESRPNFVGLLGSTLDRISFEC